MPKSFIVAYIDWTDHELRLEHISASNWREAWLKHSNSPFLTHPDGVPIDLNTAKQVCFDMDCMMNHIEV